jgi:pyruvate dehydrogenase E2 component (dihydrolipoamide acetyltransferase)
LARKIALEHRLDINTINNGTGPRGRIVKSDIQQVIENSCLNLEYAKNISGFRLAMINTLVKSKQEIPHFYMNITANVTKLVELLDDIKKQDCIETKITVNTFVIKAVAKAIEKYSDINVYWEENTVIKNKTIDVSVAVAVEDGIYTPIIRKANNKNIQDIAEEIKELAFRAKNKKLKTEEFKGGSITISNLGMCDIDCFYSIINPPQASIVSVARIIKKPVVVKETIEIGYTLTLGYAIDHRVIDGLYAAKFLAEIKRLLENPIKVLL